MSSGTCGVATAIVLALVAQAFHSAPPGTARGDGLRRVHAEVRGIT